MIIYYRIERDRDGYHAELFDGDGNEVGATDPVSSRSAARSDMVVTATTLGADRVIEMPDAE